jgi:hypothetical protein
MTPTRFAAIAPLVAMIVLLFPYPSGGRHELVLAYRALRGRSPVVIVGNSVVDHVSPCEPDSPDLPALLSRARHSPVTDLSWGGQSLEESLVFAELATRVPETREIYVLVPLSGFLGRWSYPLQRLAFNKLLAPSATEALRPRLLDPQGLFKESPLFTSDPFEFQGRRYPDYAAVKARHFEREAAARTCPEGDGSDQEFIAAYYYHTYLERSTLDLHRELIKPLAEQAARTGQRLYMVIEPVDLQRVQSLLGADSAARVRQLAAELASGLQSLGVSVVDLSDAVPNEGFADRFCACGHMQLNGRERFIHALSATTGNAQPPDSSSSETATRERARAL